MNLTDKELRELRDWIHVNVMGWIDYQEEEFPHRSGFSKDDEFGEKMIYGDHPDYPNDSTAAMMVLEKCAELTHVVLMGDKSKGGFAVSQINGKRLHAEAPTIEIAIALFAKQLFEK